MNKLYKEDNKKDTCTNINNVHTIVIEMLVHTTCIYRASPQITEHMVERFAKPVPLFSMVYTNSLIDYSRIL